MRDSRTARQWLDTKTAAAAAPAATEAPRHSDPRKRPKTMARRTERKTPKLRRTRVTAARWSTSLISRVLERGKRFHGRADRYGAFDAIAEKIENANPVEILQKAVDNIRPKLEVKSRRVGGATYQVPLEVPHDRQVALALRWIVDFSAGRKAQPMAQALSAEILDAYNNTGNATKKRDDITRGAGQPSFRHYRW